MTHIDILPILEDNYCYILRSIDGKTAVLDAGEAKPVMDFLDKNNLHPDQIISTHHHWDHVNGNLALRERYGAPVIVPDIDSTKIKTYDRTLKDGDVLTIGTTQAKVMSTPGHTMGAICLYFEEDKILFTGDTLFSMGCGRLFEGTAQDMFSSFRKISALPEETLIYCGHEYTLVNGTFALSLAPDNTDIQNRLKLARHLREHGLPTMPVSLAEEKKTNPFLQAKSADEFAALREKRNHFKA